MSGFGDDDPEDGWDAGDSVSELVDRLEAWVTSIEDEADDPDHDGGRVQHRILDAQQRIELLRRHRNAPPDVLDDLELRLLEVTA